MPNTSVGLRTLAADPAGRQDRRMMKAPQEDPITPAASQTHEPTPPHVREWQVRVSIFESGEDTNANVVLLTEAPTHLTARGQSHRGTGDTFVPEIGDEVAVARALRHLADQLLETAAQDVEAVTGQRPHIRPS